MSLKDEIAKRAAELLKREKITLPQLGVEVQVRGMMLGEKERIAVLDGMRQTAVLIALTVEDPKTGRPIWSPDDVMDQEAIGKLPIGDSSLLAAKIAELSGLGPGNVPSTGTEPGATSSSDSGSGGAPSPRLASA